jgi:poly-beta-1,6-N-acetyl-D-glucosamine synthase
MTSPGKYVIVTPVRDEERFLPLTLASVASQTVLPSEWVLVDDGSRDGTPQILDAFAREHAWARVVHRPDRGERRSGGGVMEAFHDGLNAVVERDWEYLAKLDGDLSLAPGYFEACLGHFRSNPRLGLGGGQVWVQVGGRFVVDSSSDPPFHVRGATKMYRRECWADIGGLVRQTGWDTVDEVKANMLGWETRPFRDLRVFQHRQTGGADGFWRTWVKNGRANYVVGYHPLFMLGKFVRRLGSTPYALAALALAWGFFSAYFLRTERIRDRSVIAYLRRQQLRRLLFCSSIYSHSGASHDA